MAMNIIAYIFAAIALAAGILCFINDFFGKEMSQETSQLFEKVEEEKNV